ncbi:mycothiol synthase [Streptomyces sp. SID3343]|uniref:mycothiol synthase n=1 Tax=Streptomyces sp. SID3343 TaxID=2690260 RepID=UPI00136AE887|nr:mycothiol synthase [Streptomyces sp. SID3343]MYW06441.1 mycothiol synthase [Streptomyces sp. SID3343]
MDNADVSIETVNRARASDVEAVLSLAEATTGTDGASPLSEQSRLELRHGAPAARELFARVGDRVVGFAHLDASDPVDGPSAELFVGPSARGAGIGRTLLEALVAEAAGADEQGRLRVWAHGKLPAAERLAAALDFTAFRELWQMRRSAAAVPDIATPADVRLRAFRPGEDDRAWLALNAKAFAHHPEQGGWTLDDLRRRFDEPWFDPAGFFLAEDAATGELLGFHWTKTHPATGDTGPLGEVYVVGVDPAAQGRGLGALLTAVGLRHLAERSLDGRPLGEVLLYVDADNEAAVKVYTRLGFRVHTVDVMYRR